MDNKTEILKFDLKEIYNYIRYTFKSDVLCIAAFIDPSFTGSKFREKSNEDRTYQIKNRNRVLAHYGDLAIYGILGKLIGGHTYSKGNSVDQECSFSFQVGELNKIRKNLSEDKTFDQAIKRIGYDKYLIKGDTKIGKKTYANIFEGLVGAVAIDSNWNYNAILNVYKKLIGDYKGYIPQKTVKKANISNKVKTEKKKKKKVEKNSVEYYVSLFSGIGKKNYLKKVNEYVSQGKLSAPDIVERQNEKSMWVTEFTVKELGTGTGTKKRKQTAKRIACNNMIGEFLKKHK